MGVVLLGEGLRPAPPDGRSYGVALMLRRQIRAGNHFLHQQLTRKGKHDPEYDPLSLAD